MAVLNNTAMGCAGDVTLGRVRATNFVGTCRKYYILWVRFIALGIQHAIRMRHILLPFCPAPLCHIFPHYLINGTILGGKKVTEHKMCFDLLYEFCVQYFYSNKNWARCDQNCQVVLVKSTGCSGACVKYRLLWCLCKVPAVVVLV